jgi:hypothetical protein
VLEYTSLPDSTTQRQAVTILGIKLLQLVLQTYFYKIHLNITLQLMAMTFKKSLHFRIAIQIYKVIWHPQHNTKQDKVKNCNFTISFLGKYIA